MKANVKKIIDIIARIVVFVARIIKRKGGNNGNAKRN